MSRQNDMLGDNYRVLEVRRGGMGEVFICELIIPTEIADDEELGKRLPRLALKTFQRRFFFDNATRLAFVREATTWLRLSGVPHIMPVLGLEQIGDRPFVQMFEVSPGPKGERSVADLLRHGRLNPEDAIRYSFQLAFGLRGAAALVPGLVHGDLKPDNVLLIGGNAFISDFGLVSAISLGRPDMRLTGTLAYRAPELWASETPTPSVSHDVYAFGVLLFEMLTGGKPFNERQDDQHGWAIVHQNQLPSAPPGYPSHGLPAELMALALTCLDKEPSNRPLDFSEVFSRVNEIWKEHDPFNHLMEMMRLAELNHSMLQEPHRGRSERIRSLLEMGEPRQALEELDSIPQDDYDPELWFRRGTTLSLLNRDAEALPCFERAMDGELPDEQQYVSCQSEYGLSLKRLGRFDEAQRIYEHLMTTVSDDQLPMVMVNLATVYLQQKQGEKAVRLLEPFVRTKPEVATAWANLGEAYTFVGRYREAENAYGRALRLAPQEGKIRVKLATLYMDHLGQLELAWSSLDAAFDSGHESREWLVRMLACSILLGKDNEVYSLNHALKENFDKRLAESMRDESIAMARKLAAKYSEHSGDGLAHDQDDLTGQVFDEPSTVDNTEAEPVVTVSKDIEPSVDSMVGPLTKIGRFLSRVLGRLLGAFRTKTVPSINSIDTSKSVESGRPRLPFLNFRFYNFHDFTLDFYQPLTDPHYIDTFLKEWRRARRDPRISGGSAALRGSPFYFTRCPGCDIHVLSNREFGYRITCRMCQQEWKTEPARGEILDNILIRISEELGTVHNANNWAVYTLFIQAPPDNDLKIIREVCERAGMSELAGDQFISIFLLREAVERGLAKFNEPWTAWMLNVTRSEAWARDATPRPISMVVRELQERIPSIRTLSAALSEEQLASMGGGIQDFNKRLELDLRERILEGSAGAEDFHQLATLLINQGKFDEAEQKARAAVAIDEDSAEAWGVLGKILIRREDFSAARDAFERSLELDPTSVLELRFLAVCYERLGDANRADEVYSRAISIGGGKDLWLP